jgi:hypothetical protein
MHYQITQRHIPRDGSFTNPTGCCCCTCGPLPVSVPHRTANSSHNYRTLCPWRKILLWRMTSCRQVSGRWVQAFRGNILPPSPVFDIVILIKILARLWISCPKGWTAVKLLSSAVLLTSLPSSQGERTTSFPTNAEQTRRSGYPVFGEKFSVLAYVFPVQFIGKWGYTVKLQLEGRFYLLTKDNAI